MAAAMKICDNENISREYENIWSEYENISLEYENMLCEYENILYENVWEYDQKGECQDHLVSGTDTKGSVGGEMLLKYEFPFQPFRLLMTFRTITDFNCRFTNVVLKQHPNII